LQRKILGEGQQAVVGHLRNDKRKNADKQTQNQKRTYHSVVRNLQEDTICYFGCMLMYRETHLHVHGGLVYKKHHQEPLLGEKKKRLLMNKQYAAAQNVTRRKGKCFQ